MALSLTEYRDTYSWKAAVEMGPALVRLAEELPAAEQAGLGLQLRQLMVELPGAIALDLVEGSNVRLPLALRLGAALELVERVYPALDASAARGQLAELTERLASAGFTERLSTAPAEAPTPVPAAPEAAPADVPVLAGSPAEAPADHEEAQVVHVQPDRGE